MRKYAIGRAIQVLFVFYLLFYLGFLSYSFLTFPAARLLSAFKWRYVQTGSLVMFVDYLIPVTASAVMLAYSLFLGSTARSKKRGMLEPFYKLISANLVMFLVLSFIYTVLFLGLYPSLLYSLKRMESLSRQADLFLEKARTDLKSGDYSSSLSNFDIYLAIDPKNEGILEEKSEALAHLFGGQEAGKAQGSLVSDNLPGVQDKDAGELIEMAREYFAREDYFSAHYYATLANRIDRSKSEALRLASQAWEKISSNQPAGSDLEAARVSIRKKEGYTALVSGDPVTAYYIFNELAKVYPDDPDVKSYLGKSRAGAAGISFFLDEAEKMAPFPGLDNMVFVNTADNGSREIVFIGKMVQSEEAVFFKDIEAIRFGPAGEVVYHFLAPTGKLIGHHISMNGIHRDDPEKKSLPKYFRGGRSEGQAALLRLSPEIDNLKNLRPDRLAMEAIGFASLWQVRKELEQYGYMKEYVSVEILMRSLYPFSFLIISLFSVSLGWAYRTRYLDRPPALAFLFIPLFPLIVALLVSLYLSGLKVLFSFVLLIAGFTTALPAMLVLQGVLLIAALLILAGQRTEI